MYIIILCSVIAFGFAVERFVAFRQARCDMEAFFPPLEKLIKMGKMEDAMKHCKEAKGIIARLLFTGLQNRDENIEDLRSLLLDEIQVRALPELQKNLSVLNLIARSAPMLGLLGTVLGMIGTFEVIKEVGLGDPQKMADQIRLALVTTAGGLIVAIPIIFCHAYFKSQIRKFELDIYLYLTRFLRLMSKRQEVAKKNGNE